VSPPLFVRGDPFAGSFVELFFFCAIVSLEKSGLSFEQSRRRLFGASLTGDVVPS
jgi:hypothetical protein